MDGELKEKKEEEADKLDHKLKLQGELRRKHPDIGSLKFAVHFSCTIVKNPGTLC